MHRPSLITDRHGGIALQFALLAPLMLGLMAWTLDTSASLSVKNRLQNVADSAALAAARAADMPGIEKGPGPRSRANRAAGNVVSANNGEDTLLWRVTLEGTEPPYTAEVTVTAPQERLFSLFGSKETRTISASSSAMVSEVGPICMMALSETASTGLKVNSNITVSAPNCGVHVNSETFAAMQMHQTASLEAEIVSIHGNVAGAKSRVRPAPRVSAPRLRDPFLAKDDWPSIPGSCDRTNVRLDTGTHTLSPGTYCRGLQLSGDAVVTLEPGVYFIKDHELRVGSHAQLFGTDITVFFSDGAGLRVKDSTYLDVSAPRSGPLADFLFVAHPYARGRKVQSTIRLGERGQSRYNGIFYFPDAHLILRMGHPPGFKPETLIFVADTIVIEGKETFHLAASGQAGYVTTAARLTR